MGLIVSTMCNCVYIQNDAEKPDPQFSTAPNRRLIQKATTKNQRTTV